MVWVYIALLVVALVAASAVASAGQETKPEFFDEDKLPTAKEGSPIPVVFGTYRVEAPNVVYYGDFGYTPIRTKSGK